MCNRVLFGALLTLVFAALLGQINAQSVQVVYATVETAEGIKFDVRLEKPAVTLGQNFNVRLKVINRSSKPIYIVKKKNLEITAIDNERSIEISPPYPLPIDHGDFNFTFTKIGRGGSGYDVITIPGAVPTKEGTWLISTGIGYVEKISDLVPAPPEGSDPAPWRAQLFTRLSTVSVGKLTVSIRKK